MKWSATGAKPFAAFSPPALVLYGASVWKVLEMMVLWRFVYILVFGCILKTLLNKSQSYTSMKGSSLINTLKTAKCIVLARLA